MAKTQNSIKVTADLLESLGIKHRLADDLAWLSEETGISMNKLLGMAIAHFGVNEDDYAPCATVLVSRAQKNPARAKRAKVAHEKAVKPPCKRTMFQRQLDASIAYLDFEADQQ